MGDFFSDYNFTAIVGGVSRYELLSMDISISLFESNRLKSRSLLFMVNLELYFNFTGDDGAAVRYP